MGMDRILVALDGSPRAPHVLETAIDIARRAGAHLALYRAVGIPAELPAVAFSRSPSDVAELLLGVARTYLIDLEKEVPPELRAGTSTSLAIPWQGVCEAANRARADLIVVGSHGYGGIDRLIGTTAAKIVNHAETSVLVVKEHAPN